MSEQKTVGLRWLWLAVPLVLSSAAWATVPILASSNSESAEGWSIVAVLAGMMSIALTAPAAILVLAAIQRRRRLSMLAYVAIVLAVAAPALAFQSAIAIASAMSVFVGKRDASIDDPTIHLRYGAAFFVLYTAIGIATYPFARRGILPGAIAALATGAAIVGWFAIHLR